MKHKPPKTENQLVLKYCIAGTGGMILTGAVIILFNKLGWSGLSRGMLCLPWMLSGMMLIPIAYRQGVKDGSKK